MTERFENTLQAHIHCVGDTIHDALAERFDSDYENAQVKTEYEAYGDTYVESQRYIDDDEDQRIRENFQDEYDFDEVMELLKNDKDFRGAVMDMVEYIAWNRQA